MIAMAPRKTYEDVERMLRKLCSQHLCCPGCSTDDRMSTANVAYVKAEETWDGVCTFSTYVYRCTEHALRDECKMCRRRQSRIVKRDVKEIADASSEKKPGFWTTVSEMSKDVQTIASILVDAPGELAELLTDRKSGKDLLRSYLYGMGWGANRVTETFSEIKEALR